jgi:4-amino-4-deoxy-L-arabinose transferase-like glycosyltransferase
VQLRNPQFFREFILHHNLARFSSNLYHHREPFWYYLPVAALALLPWIAFVLVALVRSLRAWWASRKSFADNSTRDFHFSFFACCWLIVPVVFFSISQSKLPGYILPAIPAGAVLLAEYLHARLKQASEESPSKLLILCHATLAAAPFVPAFVIASIVANHHLPSGKPTFIALAIAFILAAAIAFTLMSKPGLRMLRFVTLIPVILTIAAVLKTGTVTLDQTLSARPLAREIASIETEPLHLAVFAVPRELEFGLTFYRNQQIPRYERDNVPVGEHLLIAPENWHDAVVEKVGERRVSFLGHYAPQHVDYYWIAAAPAPAR